MPRHRSDRFIHVRLGIDFSYSSTLIPSPSVTVSILKASVAVTSLSGVSSHIIVVPSHRSLVFFAPRLSLPSGAGRQLRLPSSYFRLSSARTLVPLRLCLHPSLMSSIHPPVGWSTTLDAAGYLCIWAPPFLSIPVPCFGDLPAYVIHLLSSPEYYQLFVEVLSSSSVLSSPLLLSFPLVVLTMPGRCFSVTLPFKDSVHDWWWPPS